MIYLTYLSCSLFFGILEFFTSLRKKKYFKYIQLIFILSLFIFYAFNRDNGDRKNYIEIFNGNDYVADKGYIFLMDIVKSLNGSYNWIPLLVALLFYFVLFYLYRTEYVISFIFIYFIYDFMFDMYQIRNTLSISFILIGLIYLKDKKEVKFFICLIVATLFQRIGVVFLFFYFLNKLELKNYKKILGILFILELFFLFFVPYLIKVFIPDKSYYLERKPHLSILLYMIYILFNIVEINIFKSKKNLYSKEIYYKLLFFHILIFPTIYFFLELIVRILRFTNLIKWFYFFKYIKGRKKIQTSVLLYILFIIQELMLLMAKLLYSPTNIKVKNAIEMINDISNIGFYF